MADLRTVESTDYEALFAGLNYSDIKTFPVTVAKGQVLERGALVKFASGKVSAVAAASDDVFGIICDPVDATDADTAGVVYVNGDFNKAAVKVGELDINAFIKAARNVGIFLR